MILKAISSIFLASIKKCLKCPIGFVLIVHMHLSYVKMPLLFSEGWYSWRVDKARKSLGRNPLMGR